MANIELFYSSLNSPVGTLHLLAREEALVALCFETNWSLIQKRLTNNRAPIVHRSHPILSQTKIQLHEYFDGQRREFSIPLSLSGTPFQNSVWAMLQQIPYGSVWSYSAQAERLGCNSAVRAVGQANALNPICILVPCHRVIAKDGTLGGYSGGLRVKRLLLQYEENNLIKSQ